MSESRLVQKIMRAVKKKYDRAYVRKINDRNTRGIPDILIVFPLRSFASYLGDTGVLFVEAKAADGVVSEIQKAEHEAIRKVDSPGCDVLVARDVDAVMETLEKMGALL